MPTRFDGFIVFLINVVGFFVLGYIVLLGVTDRMDKHGKITIFDHTYHVTARHKNSMFSLADPLYRAKDAQQRMHQNAICKCD